MQRLLNSVLTFAALASAAVACNGLIGADEYHYAPPTPADAGSIGTIGAACPKPGTLTCAGHAQKQQLRCDPSNRWVANGVCVGSFNCDSRPDRPTTGSCQPIPPDCAAAAPKTFLCDIAATAIIECDDDLITSRIALKCPEGGGECKDVNCVCKPGFIGDGTSCTPDGGRD